MGRLEEKAISKRVDVFADRVFIERLRQESLRQQGKFKNDCSDPRSHPQINLAVLAEEFGEVAREVCEYQNTGIMSSNLENELIEVAAVACSWWEALQKAKE
jgi:NTP pyrophosphatase (non-canonical NTP hydrolase)